MKIWSSKIASIFVLFPTLLWSGYNEDIHLTDQDDEVHFKLFIVIFLYNHHIIIKSSYQHPISIISSSYQHHIIILSYHHHISIISLSNDHLHYQALVLRWGSNHPLLNIGRCYNPSLLHWGFVQQLNQLKDMWLL